MALERVVSPFVMDTAKEYEAKKAKILAGLNPETEKVVNGMIYCKRCYQPKMYDDPKRPFVVKCKCDCEVRAMSRWGTPRLAEPIRSGDFNPFD